MNYPTFGKAWFFDNLIAEIIFGVLVLGIIGFGLRYIRDGWRALRIFKIISIHNNPSRTRRKGIHARDRFMDIYESKSPLLSRSTAYNANFIEGLFNEQYLDAGILELHNLVVIKETPRGIVVEAKRDRLTRWVYKLSKLSEERERQTTEMFILDKNGKQRKLP